MKKIVRLTSAALLFFSLSSSAQIKKGSVYLGGDIGYSKSKWERTSASSPTAPTNEETNNIVVSPAIGLALKENLVAGVDINFFNSKTENSPSSGTTEQKGFGTGFFLRRYFPVANRFYLFGQARIGYSNLDFEQKLTSSPMNPIGYNTNEERWNVFGSLYPGLSYNILKSLYLELGFSNLLQIGYEKSERTESQTYNNTTTKSTSTQKSFILQSSLSNSSSLNIGVRFILPKKK